MGSRGSSLACPCMLTDESRHVADMGGAPVINPGIAHSEGVLQGAIISVEGPKVIGWT